MGSRAKRHASDHRSLTIPSFQRHSDDRASPQLEELRVRIEKRGLAPEEHMRLQDEIGLLEAAVGRREFLPNNRGNASPTLPARAATSMPVAVRLQKGNITGFEIADGQICLVRWSEPINDRGARRVVRQASLEELFAER